MCLLPAVFFKGELTVPGTILYQWPPWSEHRPETYTQAQNEPGIEALIQFSLWYSIGRRAVHEGDWPLWNPYEYMGMPLAANYQSALFYPFHVLHVLVDVHLAMTVYTFLKVFLCGMTSYLCARVMGLGTIASRFTSIAWTLSGFNMIWLYWNEATVSIWVPVLLIGVEFLIRGLYRRGFFAVALAGTLLLLAGHPETTFVSSAGIGMYMVLRLAALRRRGRVLWQPLALAVGAWLLALLVSSVQLVPFIEYLGESHAYGSLVDAATDRIQPGALTAFWAPRFLGATTDGTFWGHANSNHVSLVYPGVVVWVAACLLLTRSPSHSQVRAKALCLLLPALLFGLLAFKAPIVDPLHHLPLLNHMWSIWHISFVMFALAVLAGLGVEHWCSRTRRPTELWFPLLLVLSATAILFGVYCLNAGVLRAAGHASYVLMQVAIAGAIGIVGVVLLVCSCTGGQRFWVSVATALLALDLLLAAHDLHDTAPSGQILPETRLTDFLRNTGHPVRICNVSTPIRPGLLPHYGIEEQYGFDGIFAARPLSFYALAGRGCWGVVEPLCSFDYYLLPEGAFEPPETPAPAMTLVETIEGIDVCRNNRAFPHAFLVGAIEVAETEEAVLDALCEEARDLRAAVLTSTPPREVLPESDATSPGTARVLTKTPMEVAVEIDAQRPGVLVLTDTYYPGWKATIDGAPAEIFPAYQAFRGVTVPAGQYTVRFHYQPISFRIGVLLSATTLVCGALWALVILIRQQRDRKRRRNAHP
jgi:hypothetical protein